MRPFSSNWSSVARGVLPEKLGGSVRTAPKNPFSIYDQICDFPCPIYDLTKNSIPYLWPNPLINPLFQVCLTISYLFRPMLRRREGLLFMVLSKILTKEWLLINKIITISRRVQKPSLFMTKMAKIDILFMTKTAEKPYPMGRTYLYSSYKGVPLPSPPPSPRSRVSGRGRIVW